MLTKRRPCFLEVFLPNLCSGRLKIPSKFVKHLAATMSGSVTLRGPSGNSWHVDLIEQKGHLFFCDGWPSFVKDHSIQCGDSLLFTYHGNLEFTVQIFDQTSCEKEEAEYAKCSQDLPDLNGSIGNKRKRGCGPAFSNRSGEHKLKGTWTPVQLDLKTGSKQRKLKMSSTEGEDLEEIVINGYAHGTSNLATASERPIVLAMPAFANGQMMHVVKTHRKINTSKLKKACTKKSCTKKKTNAQKKSCISKFIEARTAHYFTSSFPYFVRVVKYSNISDRGTMKIPVSFSMAHLPSCRLKVTLRNLNGDCWTLSCVPTVKLRSRMHTLSGGWLAFARGNNIRMEDVCIFELVDKFEMRVHILRLGLEGMDSETQKRSVDTCGDGSGGSPPKIAEILPQDNEVQHPKISEQMNEPFIHDDEQHRKDPEMILGPQQDAASSSDTTECRTALIIPVTSAPSPTSGTNTKSMGQLLGCNAEGTISHQTRSPEDIHTGSTMQVLVTDEDAREPLTFTSPFPNFMKVMMYSNVGGSFTVAIPWKFAAAYLPSYKTQIVLRNVRGECWNVVSTRYGHQAKFCGGWLSFVRDNGVKVGDICIFELVDERVLQVHIFDASHRVQECPNNTVADDHSSASVESIPCTVQPEA